MFDTTVPFIITMATAVLFIPMMLAIVSEIVDSRKSTAKAVRKIEDDYDIRDIDFHSDLPKFNNSTDPANE